MKITELEVSGFRSLHHVVWKPGDLNVLIGPNAGGKTNLLKALDLLAHSARGRLAEYVKREGGYLALSWDGEAGLLKFRSISTGGLPGPEHTSYELILGALLDSVPWIFEERLVRGDNQPIQFVSSNAGPQYTESFLSTVDNRSAGASIEASFYRFGLERFGIFRHLDTRPESEIRKPAIASVEKDVEEDGSNLIPFLHTLYTGNRDFEREVDTAMRAAFGDEFEKLVFPPAYDQRIQLRIRWRSLKREQSAADLSDGTLRFLFLIAVLANPHPPPLIAIDEPETGLHPSMLPIIAEYAADAATRSQIVLATHSPSFLDAFGKNAPTVTVVETKEGKTNLHVRSGDELSYWLKEYSLGELYRTGELEAVD